MASRPSSSGYADGTDSRSWCGNSPASLRASISGRRPASRQNADRSCCQISVTRSLRDRHSRNVRQTEPCAACRIGQCCFAGGLRRSEIVGLDRSRDPTEDRGGWREILDEGLLVTLAGKTGRREIEFGRGSSDATLQLSPSRPASDIRPDRQISSVPPGRCQDKHAGPDRLHDREKARLVKKAALAAGIRGDLNEAERAEIFPDRSLRAGFAAQAEVDSATCRSNSLMSARK